MKWFVIIDDDCAACIGPFDGFDEAHDWAAVNVTGAVKFMVLEAIAKEDWQHV